PRLPESEGLLRTLLQSHAEEWRNGKVYCNAHDADPARSIVGKNFGGTIECVGGVVIDNAEGTRRLDLRFETILADIWRDSIKEVAEILSPPQSIRRSHQNGLATSGGSRAGSQSKAATTRT